MRHESRRDGTTPIGHAGPTNRRGCRQRRAKNIVKASIPALLMRSQCRSQMCCNYPAMRFFQLSLFAVTFVVGMSAMAQTQKTIDHPKVIIEEVELQGTLLPKAAQEQLVSSLKEREWEESSEWVADLEKIVVSAEYDGWPDRENQGYLGFSVGAWWKPVWREPGLLHVQVTVKVDEHQPKKLEKIEFRWVDEHLGPPLFDSNELRKVVPLKDGEIYNRDKYQAGLSAVARVYKERGFIDCTITSNLTVNDEKQTVALVLEISQGQRYYWGNIRVIGLSPELETILRARLAKDSVINPKLIADFYQEYKSLLPVGVSPETVEWHRNETLAIVDMTFDFSAPPAQVVHD
jgi:outer membrane protein assembly factor BamA